MDWTRSIAEDLRDLIGRRLSRLSPECNRILTTAGVIGREFELSTLQAMLDADDPVVDALDEASRVGILQKETRPGSVRFRFSHAFIRQTLYEGLIAPGRLRLHQKVARTLERQYADRLDEHAAELAEHFGQSTDPADLMKAIQYGERAATRAIAVQAFGEATRHLERALRVQEMVDPEDRAKLCDLLSTLAEALCQAGNPQRAVDEIAPRALALAEALGDSTRACRTSRAASESSVGNDAGARVSGMSMGPALERALADREGLQEAALPGGRPTLPGGLTERELEVLCLVTMGKTSNRIADDLVLSVRTVERHISNIYVKLDVRTRAQATSYAHRHGLVPED